MRLPWRTAIPRSGPRERRPAMPSATAWLVAASLAGVVGEWILHCAGEEKEPLLREWAALTAGGLYEGRLWQPLTHFWLVASLPWLLLVELPILLLAGRQLESILGRRHLLALFVAGAAGGGLAEAGARVLLGAADLPIAGPGAGVLAVFIALAGAVPEMDLVPPLSLAADTGRSTVRIKHGALGLVLLSGLAVVAAGLLGISTHRAEAWALPGVRALAACVVACLYMRRLGFGQRTHSSLEEQAAWEAATALERDDEGDQPVFAGPVAAAAGQLVVPRVTEVERRMSPQQYIRKCVDPILDKISLHGLGSLTDEERRRLKTAREKMARGR